MSSKKKEKKIEKYTLVKKIGKGAFGIVYKAKITSSGKIVAIKKVYQDPRYRNRELEIMKKLKHRNIVKMYNYFHTTGETEEGVYLNLVLQYVPKTISSLNRYYVKKSENIPILLVKVYFYQLCRSVAYLHRLTICHRDLKPQNLLINPSTAELRLCDFGSAKILQKDKPNVAYICSRYYRAPELLLGATYYGKYIDLWSLGCIFGELLKGKPLFPGENTLDQLKLIMSLCGKPTHQDFLAMKSQYSGNKFPDFEKKNIQQYIGNNVPKLAIDLLSKFLVFNPKKRIHPLLALTHPFFDELRDPQTILPNNRKLPKLFDFDILELKTIHRDMRKKLIPSHLGRKKKKNLTLK
ncbi:protein kinase shaggy-related [Anaeramoeba flamelloides]|uniref:Protein kinase shaggy-related n=1 Tax=Anaeramoeba flamelloides TaxID=1746091 RepID=A0ABQ8X0H1_9EUKA|nr:protein kinase shaggy-related [Anaeramoeba flamelloides]